MTETTGKNSNYSAKKALQKSGAYQGSSPFFRNIPEFQYLKPLYKDLYPHLRQWPGFKLPNAPKPNYSNNSNNNYDKETVL